MKIKLRPNGNVIVDRRLMSYTMNREQSNRIFAMMEENELATLRENNKIYVYNLHNTEIKINEYITELNNQ